MVLGALAAVAAYVTLRPVAGVNVTPHPRTTARTATAVLLCGGLIATYDGLMGPGTGTFLVLTFTAILGTDFVRSSAMAKVVNAATNLGALVVFGLAGQVWWQLAATAAAANVIGAVIGARMALRHGAGFVRVALLVVVVAMLGRLGYLELTSS
ncbi:hypothetical protein GCM10010201_30700 [Pilimelia columellifera subsp. columellifera]|uniref:Probable membrane transporter protein n=1 Tax=Pilimelia columellifera subsp. columellifera TaxID=706583 RepID=A0ABN3NRG4_9ACTN